MINKLHLIEYSLFQDIETPMDDEEGESSIPESSLISLVKLIDDEVMIQDIPSPPIVVYLKDKETHGIVGIKINQEESRRINEESR